jgi:hypothetical protein
MRHSLTTRLKERRSLFFSIFESHTVLYIFPYVGINIKLSHVFKNKALTANAHY